MMLLLLMLTFLLTTANLYRFSAYAKAKPTQNIKEALNLDIYAQISFSVMLAS